MEYLDIYDENGNYIGIEERKKVHTDALWHKTVHCWLYDENGNVYFQIRAEEKTFYTTASGHVSAGESLKEAFGREIFEEIGAKIDYEKATLIEEVKWTMDRENKDGTFFRDRVFANVFTYKFSGTNDDFEFDLDEVDGLAKVSAEEALKLFKGKLNTIKAELIKPQNGKNESVIEDVTLENFLVNKHETATGKYGNVLSKIIELTEES
jgi:Isopentenyldiphosphate isomerase